MPPSLLYCHHIIINLMTTKKIPRLIGGWGDETFKRRIAVTKDGHRFTALGLCEDSQHGNGEKD